MDGNGIVGVLALGAGVVVFFLLMLVGREIVTWYWKVNEALGRLAMIEGVLRNIDKNLILMADMAQERPKPAAQDAPKWGVGM